MVITKPIKDRMFHLRNVKKMTYAEIGKEIGISKQLAHYYCQEIADSELLDKMERLREKGYLGHTYHTYGLGLTLEQIGEVVGMSNQKVSRYLARRPAKPRRCLHDGKRMTPHSKIRLWCNDRCHNAWKRTIKLWEEREE